MHAKFMGYKLVSKTNNMFSATLALKRASKDGNKYGKETIFLTGKFDFVMVLKNYSKGFLSQFEIN
jgi:uncharacterized protein YacL (UPF0231 family)